MNQIVGAKLKYNTSHADDAGFELKSVLPNDQPLSFKFNKLNNYTTEVPIKVSYKNLAGKEVVIHDNYAQHVLDCYPFLSLVEMVEKPIVETPILVDKRASVNNELARQQAEIEELKKKLAEAEVAKAKEAEVVSPEVPKEIPLDEQTVKQLKEYALSKGIDIPYNVTAKQDIVNFIKDSEKEN